MDIERRDARIRAHAKALPKKVCCAKHWISMSHHVWMPLARHWKMPVQEIKRIVKG